MGVAIVLGGAAYIFSVNSTLLYQQRQASTSFSRSCNAPDTCGTLVCRILSACLAVLINNKGIKPNNAAETSKNIFSSYATEHVTVVEAKQMTYFNYQNSFFITHKQYLDNMEDLQVKVHST